MKNSSNNIKLVLLPGLDGTGDLFNPFITQFPDPGNIITITYPTDRFIPFEALPDYIISRLPNDQPLILLGESYSGPVAALLASKNKLDVRGVIFVATFAHFPKSFLKTISQVIPLSWFLRLPIPNFMIRLVCFGRWNTPTLARMLRKSIKANQPKILAQRARSGTNLDVRDALLNIDVPCLYLLASQDKLVADNAVTDFKTHVRDLTIHKVEGPHFILQTQPTVCFRLVADFISRCALIQQRN
jgi:pimeloyl-ACP methyl ester carboxylesterase